MNFPCPYCLGSSKDHSECRQHAIDFQRDLIRSATQRLDPTGEPVVKSLRLSTAGDELVCSACKQLSDKIYPTTTPENINAIMEGLHIKNCKNPICRCYWRPEQISY
jgi:hypothetical protein